MDIIRFEGNESVHPGEININENRDDAQLLFTFINMIVEEYFSAPARIEEIYQRIPERKRVKLERE